MRAIHSFVATISPHRVVSVQRSPYGVVVNLGARLPDGRKAQCAALLSRLEMAYADRPVRRMIWRKRIEHASAALDRMVVEAG